MRTKNYGVLIYSSGWFLDKEMKFFHQGIYEVNLIGFNGNLRAEMLPG